MKTVMFGLLSACLFACSSCRPARPAAPQGNAPMTPPQKEFSQPPKDGNLPQAQPPAVPKSGKPAPPPKNAPKPPAPKSSVGAEVKGVIDYGTGATLLRAKQKATSKIDRINEQHNRELEEALE